MIGHMILRKNIDGEDILGLKIVGGKTLSSSRKGAVIEKVKRGSIADQEGHLKPGKTNCFQNAITHLSKTPSLGTPPQVQNQFLVHLENVEISSLSLSLPPPIMHFAT